MQFTILNSEKLARAAGQLARQDEHLAAILRIYGRPPLWRRPANFATLVRIILEQQVSLKSADSMYRRLDVSLGTITPEAFIRAGDGGLRKLGVTRQKSTYLLHLSSSIATGELRLRGLARMSDIEAKEMLMRIKGIGSWTADIYLLMALRRPDVEHVAGDARILWHRIPVEIRQRRMVAVRVQVDRARADVEHPQLRIRCFVAVLNFV